MIYLIGISHSFQIYAPKPFNQGGLEAYESRMLACQYESFLSEEINRLRPQIICEEYDSASLFKQMEIDDQVYLVALRVCQIIGNICHMFIDPDRRERIALYAAHGKTEDEDKCDGYAVREGEWLRRMQHILHNNSIVVVCGADHITTFQQLLIANDYETSVVCKDFESICNTRG